MFSSTSSYKKNGVKGKQGAQVPTSGTVIQFNFLKNKGVRGLAERPLKYKILLNQRLKFMKD